jgi:hypothetical protein
MNEMATKLHWRLLFRVNDPAAFNKCLARFLQLLGPGSEPSEGRPYWKIPELWERNVAATGPDGSTAEQVLWCLLAAGRIARGWHIHGLPSADSVDGLVGVFSARDGGFASRVPGLEWASFELTYQQPG